MIAQIHAVKTRRFAQLLADGDITPRPGIERIMTMARSIGARLAIATTTSRPNVDLLCHALFHQSPGRLFQAIATGEDAASKKPAPDVYRITLERLDMPAEACIALEDSRNGLMAAKAARVRCVVSPSLYMRDECFEEADLVLEEFTWEAIESMLRGD